MIKVRHDTGGCWIILCWSPFGVGGATSCGFVEIMVEYFCFFNKTK
jgi:hypothetical protein